MSPRVAVWCPQGRENLPLAAALCRAQLPRESVVWSSDEAVPQAPDGLSADLWLVLCAGDPPPPPPWRPGGGGGWSIFPGAAARWTEATRAATEAWRPDRVLTDLLPDETDGPLWHDWWRERELAWLPAWADAAPRKAATIPLTFFLGPGWPTESMEPLPGVTAAAFGGSVVDARAAAQAIGLGTIVAMAERVVVGATDPVFVGMVLEAAHRDGIPVVSWGVPPLGFRGGLQGSAAACCALSLEPEGTTRSLRRLAGVLARSRRSDKRPGVGRTYAEWLATMVSPSRTSLEAGLQDRLSWLRARRGTAEWRALEAAWPDGLRQELGRPDGMAIGAEARTQFWRWMDAAPSDGRTFALLRRALAVFPDCLAEVVGWGCGNGAGNLGRHLLFGVGDCLPLGEGRPYVEAAASILAAADRPENTSGDLLLGRAVASGLLGRLDEATEALDTLWLRDREKYGRALNLLVRGWRPPGLDAEQASVSAGALSWWAARVDRWAEAVGAPGWLLGAWGMAALGDFAGADRRFVRAGAAAPEAVALAALMVFLHGREDQARLWWASSAAGQLPVMPMDRFWVSAARVLLGGEREEAVAALRRLAAGNADLFAPWAPSHLRGCILALALARAGDREQARVWWERARQESAIAQGCRNLWSRLVET